MKNDNISSTSCLIIDNMPFDRLFMCKLERARHKIHLCSLSKKTEKNKIRRCILTSHLLAEVIYILYRI